MIRIKLLYFVNTYNDWEFVKKYQNLTFKVNSIFETVYFPKSGPLLTNCHPLYSQNTYNDFLQDPVCCKKKERSWPGIGLWNMGPLKNLNDSKLIEWVWVIPIIIHDQFYKYVTFRIFRGHLFHKPVTGQELFLCVFLTANKL